MADLDLMPPDLGSATPPPQRWQVHGEDDEECSEGGATSVDTLGTMPQLPRQLPTAAGAAAAGASAGTVAGSHSAMLAATVRRLEQRLESERRNTQRQVHRIERRLEESLNVPSSGGRWAELEGYVDGLAETVQELMRRAEDTGQGSNLQTPRLSEEAATFCGQSGEATGPNLQGAKIVAAAVDRSQQRQCERLRQIEQLFEEYNDRLARAELHLTTAQGQHAAIPSSPPATHQVQLADLTARMGALEARQAQLDTSTQASVLTEPPASSPARPFLGHTHPILLASGSTPNASPVKPVAASWNSPTRLLQSPNETHTSSSLQVLTARVDRVVEIVGELDARVLEATNRGHGGMAELDAWTAELGARLCKLEQAQESKGHLQRDIALMCEQMFGLQAQLRDGARSLRETSSCAPAENAALTMNASSRKQVMRQLNFTCDRVAELGERVQDMEREIGGVDASSMQAQLDQVFERTATAPVWPHGEDSEDSLCEENLSATDGTASEPRCEHWQAEHGAVSFVVHNPPEKTDSLHRADGFMPWLAALWDPQRDPQEYANLQDLRHLCRRVTRLASRLQAADATLEELSSARNLQAEPLGGEGCEDSEAFSFKGRASCTADSIIASPSIREEVEDIVHEEITELAARVEDVEGNLQDMTELQEVRQQISRVGEQVLRLVVRLQNVENSAEAAADRRDMRTELNDLSEQLVGFQGRVEDAELGLERMAEGFRRVCEELSGLRTSRGHNQTGTCGINAAEEDDRLESLQEKLHEFETIRQLHDRLRELEAGREHVRHSFDNLTKQAGELEVHVREVVSEATHKIASISQKVEGLEADVLEGMGSLPQLKERADDIAEQQLQLCSRLGICEQSLEEQCSLTDHNRESSTEMHTLPSSELSEQLSRMRALEESTACVHEKIANREIKDRPSEELEHLKRILALEEGMRNLNENITSSESKAPASSSDTHAHMTRTLALEQSIKDLHEKVASFESQNQEPACETLEHLTRTLALEESMRNVHEKIASFESKDELNEMSHCLEDEPNEMSRYLESMKNLQESMTDHVTLSAQHISKLQESMTDLQERIASLESKEPSPSIEVLENRSRCLESISNLQESMTDLQERIASFESKEPSPSSEVLDNMSHFLESMTNLQESMTNLQERIAGLESKELYSGEALENIEEGIESLHAQIEVVESKEQPNKFAEHLSRLHALEESTTMLHERISSFESKDLSDGMLEHLPRLLAVETSMADLHEKISSCKNKEHPGETSENLTRLLSLEESTTNLHEKMASLVSKELPDKMSEHLTRLLALEESTTNLHEKIASFLSKEQPNEVSEHLTSMLALQEGMAQLREKIASIESKEPQAEMSEQLTRLLALEESTTNLHEKMASFHSKESAANLQEMVANLHEKVADLENKEPATEVLEQFARLSALQELSNGMSEHFTLLTALKASINELHEKIEGYESQEILSNLSKHSARMTSLEENMDALHEKAVDFESKERVGRLQDQVTQLESRDWEEHLLRHTAHINHLTEQVGGLKEQNAAHTFTELQEQVQQITVRLQEAEESYVEALDMEGLRQEWIQSVEESQASLKDQMSRVHERVQGVESSLETFRSEQPSNPDFSCNAASQLQGSTPGVVESSNAEPDPFRNALAGQLARTCLKVSACHKEVRALAGEVALDTSATVEATNLEDSATVQGSNSLADIGQELENRFGRLCESVTAFQSGVQSALLSQDNLGHVPSLREQFARLSERLHQLEERVLCEPDVIADEREPTAVFHGERFEMAEGYGQEALEFPPERELLKAETPASPGRQRVDDLLIPRSAPLSARGAGIETALARSEGRLLSASLRLEAQVRSLTSVGHDAGAHPPPESTQVDIERLAKEMEQATLAANRRANLEVHRQEALEAVESRVTVVSDRITDVCCRLDEAERGLELSERNGAALARRFERLESVVDAQVGELAADLVSVQRAAMERTRQLAAMTHQPMTHQPVKAMFS